MPSLECDTVQVASRIDWRPVRLHFTLLWKTWLGYFKDKVRVRFRCHFGEAACRARRSILVATEGKVFIVDAVVQDIESFARRVVFEDFFIVPNIVPIHLDARPRKARHLSSV